MADCDDVSEFRSAPNHLGHVSTSAEVRVNRPTVQRKYYHLQRVGSDGIRLATACVLSQQTGHKMEDQPASLSTTESWDLTVDDTAVTLAVTHRGGRQAPVLFLHGFGSTKEDFTDFLLKPEFVDRGFVAYDAPGCGRSSCAVPAKLSIPFLVQTAKAVLDLLGIQRLHLVGHSMGALTALELSHRWPKRVMSLTNIKGNLAPEDCFLSRQVFDYPASDDQAFFQDFVERTYRAPFYGSALYAISLQLKAQAESVRPIFSSMVEFSDKGDLLAKFLALPFPCIFMYGEQYDTLSYLPRLAASKIHLARIPDSGHFPMYSNPPAMWQHISKAIALGETTQSDR